MDEENLYDEFGNYVGPELDSSSSESSESDNESDDQNNREENASIDSLQDEESMELMVRNVTDGLTIDDTSGSNAIVLHEDKKYYPDASEVFGEAEVLVMEEDAQPIETPIVAPIKLKGFSKLEAIVPETVYSTEFMTSLMKHPTLIRNVAVIGALHHGKTSLLDLLVSHTHVEPWDPTKEMRYTDTRQDEQKRKLSIKATPVSLVLESTKGKSFLLNLMDCPGHLNFSDEATAGLAVSDGAIVVVDALEGVTMNTEKMIHHALLARVPLTLVVNKVDRLIIELKLPPNDAYYKLMHTIEEVNTLVANSTVLRPGEDSSPRLSPELGNVCFASTQHGWCFSLYSFAKLYSAQNPISQNTSELDLKAFSKRLWGNFFFSPVTRTFQRQAPYTGAQRSFVQFILEPLYKLYSQVLGEHPTELMATLRSLGITSLGREIFNLNPKALLRRVTGVFLGNNQCEGLVDMVSTFLPSPITAARAKIAHVFTGTESDAVTGAMQRCDPDGPLMIHIVKCFSNSEGDDFFAFGRIYSGTVQRNHEVKVLREAFCLEDDEDMSREVVSTVSLSQGRYGLSVVSVGAGNWVTLSGVASSIRKSATLTDGNDLNALGMAIFRPLVFDTTPVVKLAVEPLNPSELPKMLAGLRAISKSFPMATTKVEESGEHIVCCAGELAADVMLHDLRHMYADIEIKVADPVTSFCETVVDTSSVQCFAETPNKRNKFTLIAAPCEADLVQDCEKGLVGACPPAQLPDFFATKYNWDILASRSVWAFGPDPVVGTNVLMDDTLSSDCDKRTLNSGRVKDYIVQGFQWACREGPLCDEPIRGVKFNILAAVTASDPIHRGGGQLIPTARRVVYSSFLTASPRLMEPIYALDISCPADTVASLYNVLAKRRGHISHDAPVPGSPLYSVRGYIPVIESFGFETDLRVYTHGQAYVTQVFDHWAVVPGDPLDRSITLRPLEPSPPPHLAREFTVKTRRRKGLAEVISIQKFFDDPMLLDLIKQDEDFVNLL